MVALLLVITFGFSFALLVLLQCEMSVEVYPDWHDPLRALFLVLNMGMYTYTDEVVNHVRISRSNLP